MDILNVSTNDISGGAAIAAYRVHKSLCETGINSKMLVQSKESDDKTVIGPSNKLKKGLALLRPTLDSAIIKLFGCASKSIFHAAWLPFSSILSHIDSMSPDIIHLHWVCKGMMRVETIVWTLHDMWAFTGGCHYNDGCERFQQACGSCPQLDRSGKYDLSHYVLKRKKKAFNQLHITIVTPSKWLAECAKTSSLFKGQRIEIIHNGLNLNLFKPVDKTQARRIWNLPINKKLILFGAMKATVDYRKGFDLIHEALKQLTDRWTGKAELVIFGSSEPENPPNLGLPVHYLGLLHDDVSLALIYSAADITVVPSRQDNLSNIVVESLACGTPAVAFDIGGMSDMIVHKVNGYLAKPFDTSDLASGIDWVISNDKRHKDLCIKARDKAVGCFDIEKTARKYAILYENVLSAKGRK